MTSFTGNASLFVMSFNFLFFTIGVEIYYNCNNKCLILSLQLAIKVDFVFFYHAISKRLTNVLQLITNQVVIMHTFTAAVANIYKRPCNPTKFTYLKQL